MEKIKVSIIVPVYNTGKYLHRCINSIRKQTLTEIEVLLIDDGSTDESGEICEWYSSQDTRVRVIHKKNEGVSAARNTGLVLARGEYVGFVDSDDWIEPEMYEVLFERAQRCKADIVMCDATTVYEDGRREGDTIISLTAERQLRKDEITAQNLCEMAGAVWRGIYKKELLQNNKIYFSHELPLSEDRIFNLYAMGYSSEIYYTKKAYYNRYMREGSAVSKYYPNIKAIMNGYRREVLDVLEQLWNTNDSYRDVYNHQFLRTYLSGIYNFYHKDCKLPFLEKRRCIKDIVCCQELKDTLEDTSVLSWQEKLMKKKQITLLSFLGILFQIRQFTK